MKGEALIRFTDCRTSAAGSGKASADQLGRMPVSFSMSWRKASSENVSIPQSVWCRSTISSVPSSRWLIASERIASSVATPPALRMTWASPSSRPRIFAGSRRASMQASTATLRAGGSGSGPWNPFW